MFLRRVSAVVFTSAALVASFACGPAPDLTKIKLLPGISGYHDAGLTPAGENKLLPSVTFTLKNDEAIPLTDIDLTVAFWPAGKDVELDSKEIRAIRRTPLEPGATSESLTVSASAGFTSPHAPADFFTHSQWVDVTVRVFAKHRGRMAKLGEIPVDRRLLPAATRNGSRQ